MSLQDKIKNLPTNSGVYIMRDKHGNIIYIGKAVVLKNRVRQYFNNTPKQVKVQAMVNNIADFEYIITLTEEDALTLESNLIKKYKPYYNILLKDDKHSPYIKIDLHTTYPTIEVTRKVKRDGARYYGPYFNGINVTDIVDIIRSCYGMRTCSKKMPKRTRPCLNYDIGLCKGPCVDKITPFEYGEIVKKVMSFLSGYDDSAQEILQQKMLACAENEMFESAIIYRNQLEMLKRLKERTIANLGNVSDIDAFSYATNGEYSVVSVCMVRGNKMLGVRSYTIMDASLSPYDIYSSFVVEYYTSSKSIPHEVCIDCDMNFEGLKGWLDKASGRSIIISYPQKGARKILTKTAHSNAEDYLLKSVTKQKRKEDMTYGAMKQLEKILNIDCARRMECYDISNISGVDKVASGVCFIDGKSEKSEYRKYKIKTVEGANDFQCMAEVISRRLQRYKDGDESFSELPDLIVIDGGLGQLGYAHKAMLDAGLDINMVSLAERDEEIYTLSSNQPIRLPRTNYALMLLQRIRDEAHRFAITYHRNLRSKRYTTSLEHIKGVGEVKQKILLKAFNNITDIKNASISQLESINGIDSKTAKAIFTYYHTEDK